MQGTPPAGSSATPPDRRPPADHLTGPTGAVDWDAYWADQLYSFEEEDPEEADRLERGMHRAVTTTPTKGETTAT